MFLGRARTDAAQSAVEVDDWQRGAMLVLVALCVLAGILPGLVVDALAPVARMLVGDAMPGRRSCLGCRSFRLPRAAARTTGC
jgi:hydrogenase-4 component B